MHPRPPLPPSAASRPDDRCVAPARQRSTGLVDLAVGRVGAGTQVLRLAESGPLRLRLPRGPGPGLEAVLMNTAGGIACGDRLAVTVAAGEGAEIALATPAAEKVYRSDGPLAVASVRLSAGPGADLAWLPQETILFDEARLQRRIEADLAEDARLLLFEAVVFGRIARGEEVRRGLFEDCWRIRRGGGLVFAESMRLEGPLAALLDRPAIAAGARALASLLYVAAAAESRLEEARDLLLGSRGEIGASAWNGLLAVRFLGRDGAELRADAVRFIESFRARPMPRVWGT